MVAAKPKPELALVGLGTAGIKKVRGGGGGGCGFVD